MAGASTVGRLVIDIAADVAQLRSDMATAAGVVEAGGAAITRIAEQAKTALIGMASALSVGALAEMVASTVRMTEELNNLATKSGASVEALSALRSIAYVTGTSFDTVTAGIVKLDKAMFDAATGSAKAQQAFATLGVEFKNADGTLRAVDAVMLDVARKFSQMEDGATKTALAQRLYSKSGAELIEVLNELGAVGAYVVKITAEQAQAAENLARDWRRITEQGAELKTVIVNEMVTALDALARTWLQLSGGLREAINGIVADGSLQAWFRQVGFAIADVMDGVTTLKNLFIAFGETLGALGALVAGAVKYFSALALAMGGDMKGALEEMRLGVNTQKEAWEGLKSTWTLSTIESTKWRDAYTSNLIILDTTTAAVRRQAPAVEDLAKAMKELGKAMEGIRGEYEKLGSQNAALDAQIASLERYGIKTEATTEATIRWQIENGKLGEQLAVLRKANADAADQMERWILSLARTNDESKTYLKLLEESTKATQKHTEELAKGVQALSQQLAVQTFALETWGMTKIEVMDLTIAEAEHNLEVLRGVEGAELDIKAAELRIAKMRELRDIMGKTEALNAWRSILTDLTQETSHFLVDFVNNGSDAFKRLWQRFRDWALEALAEIAAKQIVVSIVGALGIGGSIGAQAANGISLGQGGNLLSSVLNLGGGSGAAGGLTGVGGLAESFGTMLFGDALGGAAFAGGMASPIGTAATLFGFEGGATIGAGMGLEAGLGAAVPAIGAALAIYMLGKQMGWWDKSGGPMTRQYGTAGGDLGDFGDLSTLHKLIGTDAAQTSGYNSTASGLLSTYSSLAKLLGVDPGSASFAVYSSSDPQGDAPSNVDVRANVGGTQVYAGNNTNVGRGEGDIEAEIKRQGQIAILNALKATDLPAVVKEFLNLADLGTQTLDAIANAAIMLTKLPEELQRKFVDLLKLDPALFDRLSEFNAAFVSLSTALDAGEEAVTNFKDGVVDTTESVYDKAVRLNTGLVELAANYDGSTEQTNALANATGQYVNSMVAALQQITQIRQGLSTMFGDSIRDINMAIMTSVERSTFLKNEALANIELLKKTTDPTQIDRLSKIINTDLMAVFNMLSPEEQKRQSAWFIEQLTLTGNTADAQLIKSGNNLTNVLDVIRTKLADAATMQYNAAVAFGIAAGTISESAGQMLIAANTPIRVESDVTVTVENTTDNTETTGTAVNNTNYVATGAAEGGGWGWLANPDPNVIYATPGP